MIEISEVLKFLYFQAFGVMLPGIAIMLLLCLKKINRTEFFVISYALGIVLNVVEYYVFYSLGISKLLPIAIIIIGIISICILIKKYNYIGDLENEFTLSISTLIISTIVAIITFCSFTLNNLSPELLGGGTYYQDILWNVGNVSSIQQEFPITDIRFASFPFKYHYFMHIHLAVMGAVTGIESFPIYTIYGFIGSNILLVYSVSILLYRIVKNKFVTVIGVVSLFFTMSLAQYMIPLTNHLYATPFGLAMSFAMAILCIYFVFKQFELDNLDIKYISLGIIFFVASLAAKGPVAAVILCGILAGCFIMFLKSKRKINYIIVGMLFLFTFVIFYFIVFSGGEQEIWGEFGHLVKNSGFGKIQINKFAVTGIAYKTSLILTVILYILFFLPVISIPFAISSLIMVFNIKRLDYKDAILFIISLAGICATNVFAHKGFSELYFMFTSIPFMMLFTFNITNKYVIKAKKFKIGKVILIPLFFLLLFLGVKEFTINYSENCIKGINNYKNSKLESDSNLPSYNSITRYEYEGMQWLKENTTFEDIILTDRYYVTKERGYKTERFFYYSTFSTRKMYVEGFDYVGIPKEESYVIDERVDLCNRVYNNEKEAIEKVKKDGVTYIIRSNLINTNFELNREFGEKVFENRDIAIYKLS
ncbi:hypothetical protein [Clostridium chauvoei]|uniref:Glycosyltransferase RgtA/B/C/D-like domain-containing protein n=2 Tax=Clostridium chauvoei TaxID=46867 RepID=A0A1U6J1B1_9CLOT|nr:hypothetical protein [Clostridium chauvoei]ATD54373.1 hypothetical protein BTM20_03640 [Clostridium chauvoei]ATD57943.1 hypothetical protein BTM21_09420 [Clostridium chauvoei]MBX7279736.1 hypothetical protein [Clostridium chauvoei]MBX7282105.1 hypothetical protein [Clostridium chauvoei]MBX7284627.1 hypothetical protein [Clostridium chauvoei]